MRALLVFCAAAPAVASRASAPDSFDCAMRQAAYSYGKHLLPRKGSFESLYYALNLNDPSCPTALSSAESLAAPASSPRLSVAGLPGDTIFVSPDGDDDSSGTLGAPLRNIAHAVDVACAADRRSKHPTVVLRGGTHFVQESIVLTARHSHLQLISYPGEKAVVSGGKRLKVAWEKYKVGPGKWQVEPGVNAVYGGSIDNKTFVMYGRKPDAASCEAACQAGGGDKCTVWTWHDPNQISEFRHYRS